MHISKTKRTELYKIVNLSYENLIQYRKLLEKKLKLEIKSSINHMESTREILANRMDCEENKVLGLEDKIEEFDHMAKTNNKYAKMEQGGALGPNLHITVIEEVE